MAVDSAVDVNAAECTGCSELFSTDRNFDRHRIGKFNVPEDHPEARRCMTPAEMEKDAGLVRDDRGIWRGKPPQDPSRLQRLTTDGSSPAERGDGSEH